jgi:hypothetical protein
MINILNPFALMTFVSMGACGIYWLIHYSEKHWFDKFHPSTYFQKVLLILFSASMFVLFYYFLHKAFVTHFLINPGIIISNTGSGGGFYLNENKLGWNDALQKDVEFYKRLKDFLFVTIQIGIFAFGFLIRRKFCLLKRTSTKKKPHLLLSLGLFILTLIVAFLALGAVMLMLEDYTIWTY